MEVRLRQHRRDLIRRVAGLNGLVQAALLILAGYYWHVQIAEGANFRSLADNNRIRRLSLEAPRGLIKDRHGRSLVENVPSYSLYIDRSRATDIDRSLAFAARVLEQPKEALDQVLEARRGVPKFQPVRLAEHLPLSHVARIEVENLEYPELEIAVEHLRLYRHAHRTAHILGYLGEVGEAQLASTEADYRPGDLVGKKGIEGRYETFLRGTRGEQMVVVDSRGRLVDELGRVPSKSGRDLTLTLDLDLQQTAGRLLEDKVGAIVALDPRNGEILALASTPAFDPNHFARRLAPEEWRELTQNPNHPLQNRAIQNTYPPGSVFKIVMALAGLEEGLLDSRTSAFCRGYSTVYNNRYRCWKAGGHGTVDLQGSLKHSCNVFYHQLAQRMDIDTIAHYAHLFGLGERTGIDLDGEKAGLIPSSEWSQRARGSRWFPGETISVATGQGPILTTPLQLAVLLAAVANGGHRVTPHIVRSAGDPPALGPKIPIAQEHLERVREALWAVVNEPHGTGRDAMIVGRNVAGKTGTAQVVAQETRTRNEDLPPEQRDHAWFVSFAPLEDPRLVVVVFVEHGGAGSQAAAPLARAVYEKFFETDFAYRPPAG